MNVDRLRAALESQGAVAPELTFEDVEALLDVVLPSDARTGYAWWNDSTQLRTWQMLGWMPKPQLALGTVVFAPIGGLIVLPRPDLTGYDEWNTAIGDHFFDGKHSGRPVYLDLDEDVLPQVAPGSIPGARDDPEESLTGMVRGTLSLSGRKGQTFSLHVDRLERWRRAQGAKGYPPCLAVLAFLCLIAERMQESADFGGANYYGRLCAALGLDKDSRAGRALVDDFSTQTHMLWDGLNAWLLAEDGRRGQPTAFAFDHRRHVGRPISQALLRQSDHDRLEELFVHFRLQPGQSVSLADMRRLMKEWVPTSGLSESAKRMWSQGDAAQERMATVAIIELEAWSGPRDRDGSPGAGEGRLRLSAQVRRLPRQRIELGLVVRSNPHHPIGEYTLDASVGGPAREALRDLDGTLTVVQGPSGDWSEVDYVRSISFPDLLLAKIDVRYVEGTASLAREPRRLTLLQLDEGIRTYIETDRAELGKELMLLARAELSQPLVAALDRCARPGFRHASAEELPGLPEDWILVSDVQLIAPPPEEGAEELAALVPLSWTSIVLGGGLALPGQTTWHVAQPPEVRVTALSDHDTIEATLTCLQAFVDPIPDDVVLGTFEGAGVFTIEDRSLPDGDYEVRLSTAGRAARFLTRTTFKLRSGSSFLPQVAADDGWVGHRVDGRAWSLVSAEVLDEEPECWVRGGRVHGMPELHMTDGAVPPPILGKLETEHEVVEEPPTATVARSKEAPLCLLGGAHYWILAPQRAGRRQREKIPGRCKHCGLENWWPGRPKLRAEFRRRAARPVIPTASPTPRPSVATTPVRAIEGRSTVDHDTLLDAMSHLRSGSWGSFEKLAGQASDEPWFPLETARTYSALGHVDLVFDPQSLRLTRWAIAPPTLALVSEEEAILCGFRSRTLIAALEHAASGHGGGLEREILPEAPSVIRLFGISRAELETIAANTSVPLPYPMLVSERPARSILDEGVDLGDLPAELRPFSAPSGCRIERFNVGDGRWMETENLSVAGGYRFHLRPIRYGFLPRSDVDDRRFRLCDNHLAKYLAARDSGASLIAYDPALEVVRTFLGAQPPGLLERALVLATGRAPTRRSDGTIEYAGIDAVLAHRLWRTIAPEEDVR